LSSWDLRVLGSAVLPANTSTGKGKRDQAEIKAALEALGPAPVPPLDPMLTCPEPTFEGLCKLFATDRPSLGIFATEGGQFIGGHGMSEDNKLKTAAGLSDLWDGKPIRRVRSGDGAIILPGRRVSVHLMAQPAVADILFRDRLLIEQGILSRLLVTAPDAAAGSRLWRDERPGTDPDIKRYGARLLDILEAPLPLRAGTANELEPRRLPLSSAARKLWIKFADHVERAIAPNGERSPTGSVAGAWCRSRSCGILCSPSCAASHRTSSSCSFCAACVGSGLAVSGPPVRS
jgi:hypothetical protein